MYIILLNYNGWKHTVECLESVFKLNYSNFTIIVVDNNSTDNSVTNIIRWANGDVETQIESSFFTPYIFPVVEKPIKYSVITKDEYIDLASFIDHKFVLIPNDKNEGFAAGNNLGINLAMAQQDCSFVWLLNNDTVAHPDSLCKLVACIENNKAEKVGIAGSKLLHYYSPDIIQNIGVQYNKWLSTITEIAAFKKDSAIYDSAELAVNLSYVQGASMLISKDFILDVGMLGTDYFLYYEEIDLALRGKKYGYKSKYAAGSIIYHKSGASTGGSTVNKTSRSELSDYYCLKNKIIFTRKYYPYCLPTIYLSFIPSIINRIIRRQFDRILLILKIVFTT